jgi:hypothetical protein
MIYWQYVDLDPVEVDRIKKKYLEILPVPQHFFQTLNLGIKEFMGRPIFKTVIINAMPNSIGKIHRDHRPYDNNVLAINIPLLNCDNAITEFWDTDEDRNLIQYTSSGSPYIGFNHSRCKKIDEFKLTQPVVFRTDIPHSVNNYSNDARLAISLRLVNDPWDLVNGQIHILP